MPVAHFHIPAGRFTAAQERKLLIDASTTYSRVLDSPIERVRVFVVRYDPSCVAVAGHVDSGVDAPYFTAIVLAGRPAAQRQALLEALTAVIVDALGVAPDAVRGQIVEVLPENWGIAGRPASAVRSGEIAARAAQT
ncbi:MAG TPA: tautomerase family protein [Gordonia sp. (in: high G+C Gram-positive bacteria)]|uniref:tautomerase family protein n=1 Tax=unclassified Gordonia (in: high G+C Gram-positive bacteria) TaxID=2657482 RepID=UPI000F9925F8|nr:MULTISPECIES: tautomerase family protein [unclassified Gordonia (in: high G+C Gram-positive bacteria)]RUP40031.1 MAG: 4-oxalocrotonate tautomerase [Gordonia sp. (in: high G+C Gram-positive bacteria)]HNP56604.1 tautomerase family protein [Gordonia sp. (in: high G+C Gram-positive bacteria)]HRC49693.1 tautomerase family protein [Gordonia sp. (in: high G+C Gram-positive bacteria)]